MQYINFSNVLLSALSLAACGTAMDSKKTTASSSETIERVTLKNEIIEKKKWPQPYDSVPLITREVMFGNPKRVRPRLSPDGKQMAYLAPDEEVLNIWVQTVGKDDAKAVTSDRHRGIRTYFWAPNGRQLIYIQDKEGNENWHVWSAPAGGGEATDLTPIENVQARIVAVEYGQPERILVSLNERDPKLHDVYSIELDTYRRELVQVNEMNAMEWIPDHELRIRGAVVFRPDGGIRMLMRNGAKGKMKTKLEWGPEDMFTTDPIGFAKDNRTLYMMSSIGTNTSQLRAYDTKAEKEQLLISDNTYDVTNVLTHPTKHHVEAVAVTRARTEWQVLDKAVVEDFKVLKGTDDGDFQIVSRDRKDRTWLVAYNKDDGPIVYYTYDRKTRATTRMFSHKPQLETVRLAKMKPVSYQSRDGLTIHGYLTLPPKVDARALPAVVLPHGGPWHRDRWGYDGLSQLLANRGYAALQMNFRGSTGYGKTFVNASDREWGGKMQDDITDGTRWLIETGIADPERICIMGGSYGGYATLMGLVREPDLYACGVDFVGIANLFTWLKTIPSYWMPYQQMLFQRVGHPEKDRALLEERSPVFHVDQIRAPLLIGQGANDPRVPKAEAIQIRDALKAAGKAVEYIEYPDEGHGFQIPKNRLDFFGHVEKFLAEHLGGRTEE